MKANHDIIEIAGELRSETEKAYQFFDGNVTNTISGQPPSFSLEALTKTVDALKKRIDPMEIDHADCGANYWEALAKSVPTQVRPAAINVFLGMFNGFRIRVDPDVPPDVIEFKNKDGEVVYADCL